MLAPAVLHGAPPAAARGAVRPRSRLRSGIWAGALAGVLLAAGCSRPPPMAVLGYVAPRSASLRPVIVQRDVEGEWCFTENVVSVTLRPPWNARLADHGRAVADALAKVPDANVLAHVKMSVRVEQYLLFQRICAVVRGDAGRVE